jgi:hypothetical protein
VRASHAALQPHHLDATHRDTCSIARRKLQLVLLLLLLATRDMCGHAVTVAGAADSPCRANGHVPGQRPALTPRTRVHGMCARAPRAQGKLLLLPATPAVMPLAMWAHAAGLLRAALLRRSLAGGGGAFALAAVERHACATRCVGSTAGVLVGCGRGPATGCEGHCGARG